MRVSPRGNQAVDPRRDTRQDFAALGRLSFMTSGTPQPCPAPSAPAAPPYARDGVRFGYSQLFRGANEDRSMKPWAVQLLDLNRSLTHPTWRAMLSHSRRLFANLGTVHGAVTERARLAIGQSWEPLYTGRNAKWGEKATRLLKQWMKVCDVRGGPYDWHTDLKLMSVALDRDGDFGVNLVNDNPAWPQIQIIPAHRITTRTMSNGTPVLDGPFAGCWQDNGVFSNDAGRALGFNVLGVAHGVDTGVKKDRQISSFDMSLVYRPEWSDQGRGLPSFSSVLHDLRKMDDLRDLELIAAAAQGTKTVIVGNDTGEAPAYDDDPECDGEFGNLSVETLAGGTIDYVRGGGEGDIKAFTTTRPSPAWMGLMDHLERASLAAIGWPKEYALDMSSLGGATARAILNKCQYSLDERQADLWPVALRIICWVIAVFVKNGLLEEDEDWYLWEFQLPGELSVDDGNDRSNDRDDLRSGLNNKRRIFGRRGLNWVTEGQQRKKEVDALFTDAREIADAHEVSLETALAYLETHTPNGNLPDGGNNPDPTSPVQPADAKPAKKKTP